jgi:hypothetical protein
LKRYRCTPHMSALLTNVLPDLMALTSKGIG